VEPVERGAKLALSDNLLEEPTIEFSVPGDLISSLYYFIL